MTIVRGNNGRFVEAGGSLAQRLATRRWRARLRQRRARTVAIELLNYWPTWNLDWRRTKAV